VLADWFGPRAARRPAPRLGVALSGAAAAMLAIGAITVGGDQLVSDGTGGGSQLPGLAITFGVVLVGVTLVSQYRHGPLAAAGAAASAISLPALVEFLTYSSGSAPSFSAILVLSTAGWTAGYLAGPGRGHTIYLGAALIGLWLWFVEATEHVFSFPTGFLLDLTRSAGGISIGDSVLRAGPSPSSTNIGIESLVFGLGYLGVMALCDRRDHRGIGVAFAFSGVTATIAGIVLLSNDLEQVGTGIALTLAGALFALVGSWCKRRGTNWVGGALMFAGVSLAVADPFDTPTSFGLAEIVAGSAVILVAHWIVTYWHEQPETDDAPSNFYNVGSVQPSGPPPPPAGSVLG
jgi:hypothetical protein